MDSKDRAKVEQIIENFINDNEEIFFPSEEVSKIIQIVKNETDEDLMKLKLHVELQSFANKVSEWREQQKKCAEKGA